MSRPASPQIIWTESATNSHWTTAQPRLRWGIGVFPKSICTSVNHVVCHGIPGDNILREGDVINIDVTPILDGWHGDLSRMYPVGMIGVKAQRLIDVTYDLLMMAIDIVKPGTSLGDIGHVIQSYVENEVPRWYAISAVMGWAGCFIHHPACCIMAIRAKAWPCAKVRFS